MLSSARNKKQSLRKNDDELRKRARAILSKKMSEVNKRSTHMFMHEKKLVDMPEPKNPTHVVYAYYHNNNLTEIKNLGLMYNLTHLHLQWNKIEHIHGLEKLYKLKKLYLGNNCISVVENLEGLKYLEELHIEKQNVEIDDPLCFDPRSMMALGASLRILDVSENKISDLSWAKPLRRLEVLICKRNRVADVDDAADSLCSLTSLVDANFIGNPMTKKHRYKETMIARCSQLRVLDSITIHSNSKVFLQNFDRAVRLRQMHDKNKFPLTNQGKDDFFELNMLNGQKVRSAMSLEDRAKYMSLSSKDNFHFPKPQWRNQQIQRANLALPPMEPPPMPKQPTVVMPSLIKGILKKPMPMKSFDDDYDD